MSVPSIIVKQDIETDVQQFTNFLYRWSPEKQCLIIRAYPGLTDAVQQGEETGEKLIGNFVREQYRLHQAQIEILVADMTLQVRKDGARVLEVLGTIMEYSWPKNDSGYTVIPTLLPFSPFHQPVFFFSLERFLRTNASSVASNYGLTAVIAHEVSHIIQDLCLLSNRDAFYCSTRSPQEANFMGYTWQFSIKRNGIKREVL